MSEYYKSKKRFLLKKIIIFLIVIITYLAILEFVLREDLIDFLLKTILYMPIFAFGFAIMFLQEKHNNYTHGEEGENIVGAELLKLEKPGGFFSYNDVHLPGREDNIDHIVVSRKGIFAIETKNNAGTYMISGKNWLYKEPGLCEKYKKPKSLPINQAISNAVRLKKYLCEKLVNDNVYVEPVVVLVGSFDKKNSDPDEIVISPNMLKDALYSEELRKDKSLLILVKKELDKLSESSF